jgi:hypothetical protein
MKGNIYLMNSDVILSDVNPKDFNGESSIWIYNVKRKIRLNIPLKGDVVDYIRASSLDNNTFLVALVSSKGRVVIYRIFIGEKMDFRKIFTFEDYNFPILELLFCPYNEFEFILKFFEKL